MPADGLQPAEHDGEEVVEVVGDAAGELAHSLHLLRLAQGLLGLLAGFVLRFKLAGAFPDAVFQRLGEGAQLSKRALPVRHVDVDADDAHRLLLRIVEDDCAGLYPAQRLVGLPGDAELSLELAGILGKGRIDDVADVELILAKHAVEPALIAAIEIRQPIQREKLGREPNHAGLDLPLEDTEAAGLLGKREQVFAVVAAGHRKVRPALGTRHAPLSKCLAAAIAFSFPNAVFWGR